MKSFLLFNGTFLNQKRRIKRRAFFRSQAYSDCNFVSVQWGMYITPKLKETIIVISTSLALQPKLLIPFRSDRNGRNISYRYANRYEVISHFTSNKISGCFRSFREFRGVSVNTGWDGHFGRYIFLEIFFFFSFFCLIRLPCYVMLCNVILIRLPCYVMLCNAIL